MKKFCFLLILLPVWALGEDADQNPNHKKSFEKHKNFSESLTKLQGTTSQETYKAYDEFQSKERLKEKRKNPKYKKRRTHVLEFGNFCYNFHPKREVYAGVEIMIVLGMIFTGTIFIGRIGKCKKTILKIKL